MSTRVTTRIAAGTLTAFLAGAALASPALASDAVGVSTGDGLGTGKTLLIYVGIPVAVFVVVALLTYAPSMLRRPRYRPGRDWAAEPVWFNGPANPDAALASLPAGESDAERRGGGASARW